MGKPPPSLKMSWFYVQSSSTVLFGDTIMAVVGHLWNYIGYLRLQSGYTPHMIQCSIFHGLAYIKIIVALTVAALIHVIYCHQSSGAQ